MLSEAGLVMSSFILLNISKETEHWVTCYENSKNNPPAQCVHKPSASPKVGIMAEKMTTWDGITGFALTQKSAFFTQILRAGRKKDKLHAFWGRKFHKSMKIQTAHLADTTCQYGPAVNNKRSFTETQQTKIAPLPCNRHIIPYQILS